MTTTQRPSVADSIEQAAELLDNAFAEIMGHTDDQTVRVNQSVIDRIDYQTTLNNLHKIAIMCRRLEFQLTEYKTFNEL